MQLDRADLGELADYTLELQLEKARLRDAAPEVNPVTRAAPFNPANSPGTSWFIPYASAGAGKIFPAKRHWIMSVAKSSICPR